MNMFIYIIQSRLDLNRITYNVHVTLDLSNGHKRYLNRDINTANTTVLWSMYYRCN